MATKTRQRRKRGTGSVKFQHGSWYFIRRDPETKKSVWTAADSEMDAEQLALDWQKQRAEDGPPLVGTQAFKPFAERWLKGRKNSGGLSASTITSYRSILDSHLYPVFADQPLNNFTRDDVQEYIASRQDPDNEEEFWGDQERRAAGKPVLAKPALKPESIRNHVFLLGAILQAALDAGLARGPLPTKGVELPKDYGFRPTFLTQAEFDKLLTAIPKDHQMLFLTLKELGLRLGEALALTWGDYRYDVKTAGGLEGGKLRVERALKRDGVGRPKTKNALRTLPVSPGFHERLMEHQQRWPTQPEADDLVFPSTTGTYLNPSNLRNRVFSPAVAKAKLPDPLRIHDLRHTCASLAIQRGVQAPQLSRFLGHHSVRLTLDTYTHLYDEQLDEAIDTL